MRIRIVTPERSFYVYGEVSIVKPPGVIVTRLTDGSLSSSNTHQKRTLVFDIKTIHYLDLSTLLKNSNKNLIVEFLETSIPFKVSSGIQYKQYTRFPDYYQASFSGEEL